MKFSIATSLLSALTGSSLLAFGNGADEPEAVPIMAPDDGDIAQAINDTITDVIDSIGDSPGGQFLECWGDDIALQENAEYKAAEDAYFASMTGSEAQQDGEASTSTEYTITVDPAALTAYETACNSLTGTVWDAIGPGSSASCMKDGTAIIVIYENGSGICYPDSDACKGFDEWAAEHLDVFIADMLTSAGITCETNEMPVSAAVGSSKATIATAAAAAAATAIVAAVVV